MNEKEFLKEHPSLKGKRIDVPDCQKCSEGLVFLSNVIHETQLDKAKVKGVIDEYIEEYIKSARLFLNESNKSKDTFDRIFWNNLRLNEHDTKRNLIKIKKELGVD